MIKWNKRILVTLVGGMAFLGPVSILMDIVTKLLSPDEELASRLYTLSMGMYVVGFCIVIVVECLKREETVENEPNKAQEKLAHDGSDVELIFSEIIPKEQYKCTAKINEYGNIDCTIHLDCTLEFESYEEFFKYFNFPKDDQQ